MTGPGPGVRRGARAFDRDARAALGAIGRRADVARRLELGSAEAILRSVVEAAVALFEAEAASIALYERGVALQARCERLLGEAELKVQQLMAQAGGALQARDVRPEDATDDA